MMMIESWPQRGGVIGDGLFILAPVLLLLLRLFFLFSLVHTHKKTQAQTHIHGPLLYRHSGTLYTRHNEAKAKRRRGYSSSCFIVTPPFFQLSWRRKYSRHTHTRPPGRQVDIWWGPMSWVFSIVCCWSVPFHHRNHLFLYFFWIHNVMIQLCVSSIDSRDASAMSNHRRDVV